MIFLYPLECFIKGCKSIISENLLREPLITHRYYIFQQDKAPTHVSSLSKLWFRANDALLFYWSLQKSDINEINNMWT